MTKTKNVIGLIALMACGWFSSFSQAQTFCANEWQRCNFSGTQTVRYGASGVYVTKSATDGIECNNDEFGDPVPGKEKTCEVISSFSPSSISGTESGWQKCAGEWQHCSFTGTKKVRYGIDGVFVIKSATDGIECNNDVFGDPVPGKEKFCETPVYSTSTSTSTSGPSAPSAPNTSENWVTCASEWQRCSFSGTQTVRYGGLGFYVTKIASGGIDCNNDVFGDPLPGIQKKCSYLSGEFVSAPSIAPSIGSEAVSSPYSSSSSVLDWNDSRIRWWVRADKTNYEIGAKFRNSSVQGTQYDCYGNATQGLDDVPEPSTNFGRPVLARSGGFFQHRIFDGMCLWKGERQRSAINSSEQPEDISSMKVGKTYWFAFGGKFHSDMFSQTDPTSELYSTQILDFHTHPAASNSWGDQGKGASPLAVFVDGTGYMIRYIWNYADNGVRSPTGEKNWDDAERVTMLVDRKKDATNPHFFAFRFVLNSSGDPANASEKPFMELYRQIGVDGSIVRIGRWDTPNTFSGSANILYPKYGLHQWLPNLTGQPNRSIDMAGAILVEDLPGGLTLTPQVIFNSLTVAVPRGN